MVKMINDSATLWLLQRSIASSHLREDLCPSMISLMSLDAQRSRCSVSRPTAGPSSDGYVHRCQYSTVEVSLQGGDLAYDCQVSYDH